MTPVIKVGWVLFDKPLDAETFDFYCAQLPKREQEKLHRFKRWEDATASLTGKILLMKLLTCMGMGEIRLSAMRYTENDRPYFNDTIDFNISHSGNCVACAVAVGSKVGIDIEQIRAIKLSDLGCVLNDKEHELVNASAGRNKSFYEIWTKKEAIVKADGCGLNVELNEVDTTVSPVKLNGELWQVKQIAIENDYLVSVARNNPDSEIEQVFIDL